MIMATAWLGLGSNLNAEANIRAGMSKLQNEFEHVSFSTAYASKSVGFDGDDFINLVARIETAMQPVQLREYLRHLEDDYGRKRDVPKFSDRSLDIDILLYDDLVVYSPLLEIPRAEILKFAHVLKPLADLEPTLLHPTEHKTMADIWRDSGLDDSCLSVLPDFA